MTARRTTAARPRPGARPPLDRKAACDGSEAGLGCDCGDSSRHEVDAMKRASVEAAEQALELSEAITRRPARRRTRG